MRYPPNISAKATIRSDSPRQSQYAFRNIDLAARETRKKNNTYWSKNGDIRHKVAPFFPENNAQPSKTQKSFSGEEWNAGNMTAMTGVNSFTDSETITNINMQTAFDTAMTDQSNHSRGFTPQSSNSYNHSSSNTSYSPSQVHDEESTATQQASTLPNPGTNNSYAGFAAPKDGCNIFNSQGSDSAGSLRQEDPFKIPPDWDLGAGAMPATLSGMTPEGGWEKMMEGMNWEQRTI